MSGDIRYIALPCWRKVIQKGKSGWFHLVSINLRFHWGVHLKILLFSNFSNKQASASKKNVVLQDKNINKYGVLIVSRGDTSTNQFLSGAQRMTSGIFIA